MARTVQCIKLGREAEGLDFPPWPGELGKRIFDNVSKDAWQQWLQHQTMLINENRLNPMNPQHKDFITKEMENYFFGTGSEKPAGFVKPK